MPSPKPFPLQPTISHHVPRLDQVILAGHILSACDMNTSHEPSDLASSFETAVEEYETQTGIRLVEHPLAKKLGKCDLSSINRVLRDQSRAFRGSHPRLTKSAKLVVHSLHALSTCSALSESIGLVVRRRALIGSLSQYLTLFRTHSCLRKQSSQALVFSSP